MQNIVLWSTHPKDFGDEGYVGNHISDSKVRPRTSKKIIKCQIIIKLILLMEKWLILFYILVIWDVIVGVFKRLFLPNGFVEVPLLSYQPTTFNNAFVSQCKFDLRCYRPSSWLSGPWAQMSFISSLGKSQKTGYNRKMYYLRDGVSIAVDFCAQPHTPIKAPLLVVCHGLGGGSDNGLIIRTCEMAAKKGWRAAVYIRRGHDGVSLLPKFDTGVKPKPFPCHANCDDLLDISKTLRAEYPDAPMLLIGFSAGGNLVARFLGEAGYNQTHHPYLCGIVVSNGFDTYETAVTLKENKWIADQMLLSFLKTLFNSVEADVKILAELNETTVDWDAVKNATTVFAFEEALMVPLYGYKTIKDFYDDQSSAPWLKHVNVPLLSVSGRDDPIIKYQLIEHAIKASKENARIFAIVTQRGGHLGWLERVGQTWLPKVIFSFLETALAEA